MPVHALAQDSSLSKKTFRGGTSIGANFYLGSYLTTRAKAEYIRDSYSYFGEIFFERQTRGDRDWQISHNRPQWGVALLFGNSGSKKYIGNMAALYAYMNSPIIATSRYQGSFLLGFGPGWASKPYDVHNNSKNTLIGTHLNAFIVMGLQNEFKLTRTLHARASINFMHLSNGGTTLPNLGLNMPSLSAGMRWSFHEDEKPVLAPKNRVETTGGTQFNIYTTVGLKQTPWIGANHYLINVLQGEISKRIKLNYSLGGGLLLLYNRSISSFPYDNPSVSKRNNKKVQAGVYASYEHFFGKISVPVHAGAHVYNQEKSPLFFQQFGLRYRWSKHWGAELLLKSQLGKADFIHTGIGYHF
jgi:hypothetical protein